MVYLRVGLVVLVIFHVRGHALLGKVVLWCVGAVFSIHVCSMWAIDFGSLCFASYRCPLDHLGVGAEDIKVGGGKLFCLLHRGYLPVVGAPLVALARRLIGVVLSYGHPGDREGLSGVSGHTTGMQGTSTDATFWCGTTI